VKLPDMIKELANVGALLRPLAFRVFDHAQNHKTTSISARSPVQLFEKDQYPERGSADVLFRRTIDVMKDGIVAKHFGLSLRDLLELDNASLISLEKTALDIREARADALSDLAEDLDP